MMRRWFPLSSVVRECAVCHSQTVSEPVAEIGFDCICITCVEGHKGPGKFEAYEGEDLGKVLLLDHFAGISMEDDYMWNDGWGYCGRFDNYLLFVDTNGFVTFEEFDTVDKADQYFMRLYKEGWGAQEDDAYIGEDGSVWFSGKAVHVWENKNGEITERRRLAAIRLEMSKQGFYPNVWIDNGRGNLSLVENL
jgi:hypothetical protein